MRSWLKSHGLQSAGLQPVVARGDLRAQVGTQAYAPQADAVRIDLLLRSQPVQHHWPRLHPVGLREMNFTNGALGLARPLESKRRYAALAKPIAVKCTPAFLGAVQSGN